jgi:hypothetical protein
LIRTYNQQVKDNNIKPKRTYDNLNTSLHCWLSTWQMSLAPKFTISLKWIIITVFDILLHIHCFSTCYTFRQPVNDGYWGLNVLKECIFWSGRWMSNSQWQKTTHHLWDKC